MPQTNVRDQVLQPTHSHLAMRDTLLPPHELDTFEMITRLQADIEMFQKLRNTWYFNPHTKIPSLGLFTLHGKYAKNPAHHELFTQMLRVSPGVFSVIVELIKPYVFCNNSNVPQTLFDYQLAVTLYRMGVLEMRILGRYCSWSRMLRRFLLNSGQIHCLAAIESLHNTFVWPWLPRRKKLRRFGWMKTWASRDFGERLVDVWWNNYCPVCTTWYGRWCTYYTCKSNYGLNLQVKIHPC